MDICPKCGLPKQACVCEKIAREEQRIKVMTVKRKFGKLITVITGLSKDVDKKAVVKSLKTELACGGTLKNNVIELQGNHRKKVKPILEKMGFSADSIED